MKKILIIQTSFIGDVILATSLIETLAAAGHQTDFLLRKGNESLLKGHPNIKKLWVWDKNNNKYGSLLKLGRAVRSEHYDIVINLQRFATTGLLTGLSGAKEKRGYRKNPFSFLFNKKYEHLISDKGQVHEIERNHIMAEGLSEAKIPLPPKLYPSAADMRETEKFRRKAYYCIAPASVWFTKQLPEEKWTALVSELPPEKQLYFIGAPGDFELCRRIAEQAGHPRAENLCGKLSLSESAALISQADAAFVNDSAPLHLASCFNTPTVAFFCSTVPAFGFGPLSDIHIISEVKDLNCRPCGLHGHRACPQKHFGCGKDHDTERVLQFLKENGI